MGTVACRRARFLRPRMMAPGGTLQRRRGPGQVARYRVRGLHSGGVGVVSTGVVSRMIGPRARGEGRGLVDRMCVGWRELIQGALGKIRAQMQMASAGAGALGRVAAEGGQVGAMRLRTGLKLMVWT